MDMFNGQLTASGLKNAATARATGESGRVEGGMKKDASNGSTPSERSRNPPAHVLDLRQVAYPTTRGNFGA